MIRSILSLVRRLIAGFARRMPRSRLPGRAMDIVVGIQHLRMPAGAADEQCIAEIEEHWRGSKNTKEPFARLPKQLGPFG